MRKVIQNQYLQYHSTKVIPATVLFAGLAPKWDSSIKINFPEDKLKKFSQPTLYRVATRRIKIEILTILFHNHYCTGDLAKNESHVTLVPLSLVLARRMRSWRKAGCLRKPIWTNITKMMAESLPRSVMLAKCFVPYDHTLFTVLGRNWTCFYLPRHSSKSCEKTHANKFDGAKVDF